MKLKELVDKIIKACDGYPMAECQHDLLHVLCQLTERECETYDKEERDYIIDFKIGAYEYQIKGYFYDVLSRNKETLN